MARSRKIKRNRKKKKSSFLPESLQAFIARRLVDGVALIFFGLGLFILLSLGTYDRRDPSLNTAPEGGDAIVNNAVGTPGAYFSDVLIQSLGYAGLAIGLSLCVWGFRVFRRVSIRPFLLRVTALLVCTICFAIAAAPYSVGGSAGSLIFDRLIEVFGSMQVPYLDHGLVGLTGFVALALFLYSVAVSRYDLASAWFRVKVAVYTVLVACVSAVQAFQQWIAHYNQPEYARESSFKLNLTEKLQAIREQRKQLHAERQNAIAQKRAKASKVVEPVISQGELSHDEPEEIPDLMAQHEPVEQSISSIPVVTPQAHEPQAVKQPRDSSAQARFVLNDVDGEWQHPPTTLIQDVPDENKCATLNEDSLRRNAELLKSVLADFNIKGDIVSIYPGPVVTLYELEPAPGTKSAKVISLADDIARSMSAISVRCAVVPGRNVIGIELPNKVRQTVYMKEMLESRDYDKTSAKLPLILGKDIGGQPILADLAKMPHLLVAGTTGSGKSVAVNTMIMSLLYRLSPEKCRFIMIDPKMLELSVYDDIPHLLSPVVTDPGKAIVALKWAVHEMEERYRNMSKLGVRNIDGYNQRMREAIKNEEKIMHKVQTGFDPETGKPTFEDREMELAELPYIVVIVDEFADLMLVAGKDVENAIQRLAQMARAAGLHLIMATQRPSVDVITGVVKANFPTRISFQVTSKIDSRTILGDGGAEQLLGMGDMLYMPPGGNIKRVHGPFVSDEDVEKTTRFLKAQAAPSYITDVTSEEADFGADSAVMNAMFGGADTGDNKVDELYDKAVAVIAREGKVSTSFIQRHLQIGYNRAARIVEEMERQGVISPASSTGKRQILISDHSNV